MRYGYLSVAEEIATRHKQALPSDRLYGLNPGCGFGIAGRQRGRRRPPEETPHLSLHCYAHYMFFVIIVMSIFGAAEED